MPPVAPSTIRTQSRCARFEGFFSGNSISKAWTKLLNSSLSDQRGSSTDWKRLLICASAHRQHGVRRTHLHHAHLQIVGQVLQEVHRDALFPIAAREDMRTSSTTNMLGLIACSSWRAMSSRTATLDLGLGDTPISDSSRGVEALLIGQRRHLHADDLPGFNPAALIVTGRVIADELSHELGLTDVGLAVDHEAGHARSPRRAQEPSQAFQDRGGPSVVDPAIAPGCAARPVGSRRAQRLTRKPLLRQGDGWSPQIGERGFDVGLAIRC